MAKAKKKTTTTTQPSGSIADYLNSAPIPTSGTGLSSAMPGQPTSASGNLVPPIGVGQGYVSRKSIGTWSDPSNPSDQGGPSYGLTGPGTSPHYFQGDEWGTVSGFPTSPQGVIQLQQWLVQAGFLNPKQVIVGQWDSTSAAAFAQLLGSANQRGMTWDSALGDALSTSDQTNALGATTRQPLVVNLRNEDDLRAVLQSGSQNVFGKYLDEADVQKFISGYHAQETAAATSAYNMTGTGGTGGSVTGPPQDNAGINLAMAKQMYADHPVTAEMSQFVENFNALKGALGGSNRPAGGIT